jgi:glycosyltransferase involved in cell wall biosynthesis
MNDVEWIQALSSLIEDEALRRDMGLAGRKVFEEGYTLETNAPKLLCILKGSAEQRG